MEKSIKEESAGGKKFTAKDLQDLYTNKDKYENREIINFRSKNKQDCLGLVFFNGIFARNCLSANSKIGSMVIAALNDPGIFGQPVSPPYFLTADKKRIIVYEIKGEVVIIKTNEMGKPLPKLIIKPTVEQIKKVSDAKTISK